MGIPSYFTHIVKEYGNIIKSLQSVKSVDNLYLDCNSILYDVVRSFSEKTPSNEEIYNLTCRKLTEYIEKTNVRSRVIIAFDGVAPVAKLEQQRTRRFKGALLQTISNTFQPIQHNTFDTSCITPGTSFMKGLSIYVHSFFKARRFHKFEMIIYTDTPGEGEHKIFEYIRKNIEYHKTTNSLIYGLDADLIMLCMNHLHISKQLYLYRETPHFIRNLNDTLKPNETYILDIYELSCALRVQIHNTSLFSSDFIHDYVFVCFFLGNDFMPHFPSLNLRRNGMDVCMDAYKECCKTKNFRLVNMSTQEIVWKNVKTFIKKLAYQEEERFIHEDNYRKKLERRKYPTTTPKEKEDKLLQTPTIHRERENFINPHESHWQTRYYQTCFKFRPSTMKIKHTCFHFIEALEWTWKYYSFGCPDWHWFYPHHYAPLLQDIVNHVPYFETNFIQTNTNKPIQDVVQLIYVLPPSVYNHIPSENTKFINSLQPIDLSKMDLLWCYSKYIWESHIIIESYNVLELEKLFQQFQQNKKI